MNYCTRALVIGLFGVAGLAGCGISTNHDSTTSADRLRGEVLGVGVADLTIDELQRFVAGEEIAVINRAMNEQQKDRARRALGQEHRLDPARVDEALASPKAIQLIEVIREILKDRQSATNVPAILRSEAADGFFTVFDLLKAYPVETLHFSVTAFPKRQPILEGLISDLEVEFAPPAE